MSELYTAINGGLVVLIWLVQIIIYPGMRGWDKARFVHQHRDYCRRIAFIVGPLMCSQAALALYQAIGAQNRTAIVQVLLIAVVWGVTIFVSMPLHGRLGRGYDARALTLLINTNWLRTVGWTLICLLDLFR